jgi:hypothetical protein
MTIRHQVFNSNMRGGVEREQLGLKERVVV